MDPKKKNILHEKQEKQKNQQPFPETLVTSTDSEYFFYTISQALDADAIRHAALHTGGAAGPSGVDAVTWRRWSNCYNTKSVALCRSITSVRQRLCSSYVNSMGLTAFNACRLILLDKYPGVRPYIGVIEVCRWIIGSALMRIVKQDILESATGSQFCAGLESGCEVHCMT